jgi:tetratricopeptide (TPR) repeat protein
MVAKGLTRRLDACPDSETLAAYLDGRLEQDERECVTAHVADCDTCYFVVAEIAQTATAPVNVEPDESSPAPQWWKSRPVVWWSSIAGALATTAMQRDQLSASTGRRSWASKPVVWSSSVAGASVAGALAAAAMLWLAVSGGWLWSRSNSAAVESNSAAVESSSPAVESNLAAVKQSLALQAALVAAVGNERLVEPRLTGGFAYGPLRGTVRSGQSFVVHVSPDVQIAAAQIEKEDLANRTALTLRALGAAKMALGDIYGAVTVLEGAADRPMPDPRTLSDLAAAYIIRATRTNQFLDFMKALAVADRAVKADPKLAEAWFNRAYALEQLSRVEARDAWAEYLKVDDQSGWADEARQHLRALGGQR